MPISQVSTEAVLREGYVDPKTLLEASLARAQGAVWHALPIDLGHYVSWQGNHFESIPGMLSGERSVMFYLQQGPYLKVPDDAVARIKSEAAKVAAYPLQDRIDQAMTALKGDQ